MTLDQHISCPFFDYIDNETDNELAGFIEGRSLDTEKFKEVLQRKIAELQKAVSICEELERAG